MCTIFFAINESKQYPLIFLANRDESYERLSHGLHLWPDENFFAGKDLQEGGIWTGIDKKGHLGFLTNFRDLTVFDKSKKSRGHLIVNYFDNTSDLNYLENRLKCTKDDYNLYNLVIGHYRNLYVYSNLTNEFNSVSDGIHGLSNHLLDTEWFKVKKGKVALKMLIAENNYNVEDLFKILNDKEKSFVLLPQNTGLSDEIEYQLSSVFIESEKYGTLFQTVILIDRYENATIVERRKKEDKWIEKRIYFKLED